MAADSRPSARKRPWFPALAFSASLIAAAVLFLLVPNPLMDRAFSSVVGSLLGKSVAARQVRLRYHPGRQALYVFAGTLDLSALSGGPDSTASEFVRRHGLGEWLVLYESRWVLTRRGQARFLRLLGSRSGESSLKGGVRLDDGRPSRANAAVWIPGGLWKRFPDLVEKRFAQDAQGRRLFKLTWNEGRWRLWGRSAPVLEASWR